MEQRQVERSEPRERREHQRCQVGSRASLVDAQDVLGRFLVENLSVGGALLSGISAPPPGRDALALLHLPWHGALSVGAQVVHHLEAGDRRRFGVRFSHPSSGSARALEQALDSRGAGLERRPYLTALIYTDRASLHLELERDLARLGVRSFAARSPEEVIRWVTSACASLVLIDVWTDPPAAVRLLGRLRGRVPHVHRIAVLDASSTLLGTPAVAVACAQATLLHPWDRLALAAVIGRSPPPPTRTATSQ
jgi:hypothetical protein